MLVGLLFGLGICLALVVPLPAARGRRKGALVSSGPTLGKIAYSAPFGIWIESGGQVAWVNDYCLKTFMEQDGHFKGIDAFEKLTAKAVSGAEEVFRLKSVQPESPEAFSIQSQKNGAGTVFYAKDATLLAETENELKRFIQTLTATFAHLPIGIAVFDRERDLTLFNPALSSLLELAPDWLARRPSMRAFLDRLRNNGSIPEPRDFTTLRQEFAELESGAFTGKYEVDWALPSGAIYRVTGRPHPRGGAALLFEDISRTAAMEAGYRAEIRQLYAALESLSEAVAIFNQAGELTYANDAFDELWSCTLSTAVAPPTVTDVSRLFQKNCLPTPVWGEFRNFIHDLSERSQWQAQITHTCGAKLTMTVSPIADGRVFCEFKRAGASPEPEQLADST
ncbi:PAS-domain containing protein [Neptunicoccus cionae]|uniref:PAS domain-containing protein n=1 Tax=Neptunicoccus cionae TaxID=2035344 RepID=A0A916QX93_9RHOB|nr:PAS-domain containing protein [Amylibacter cionae]GGA18353.1 hypothetical protein GCM10011498_18780 [Amylibacter cionae]